MSRNNIIEFLIKNYLSYNTHIHIFPLIVFNDVFYLEIISIYNHHNTPQYIIYANKKLVSFIKIFL